MYQNIAHTVTEGESFSCIYVIGPSEVSGTMPESLQLEAGASASVTLVVLPGVDTERHIRVDLNGRGASFSLNGIYVCGSEERVGISVEVRHNVPECVSRQLLKGIAGGQSRVDFYGRIVVAPDAQKTEAYQENHNLLLSDDAKVRTRPQLEIYADDVKCSHGATVGSLNEEEQFYMRSRGISLEEARLLQMLSFLYPALGNVGAEEREHISGIIAESLKKVALKQENI